MIVHERVDRMVKMSGTAIIRFYYRLKQQLETVFCNRKLVSLHKTLREDTTADKKHVILHRQRRKGDSFILQNKTAIHDSYNFQNGFLSKTFLKFGGKMMKRKMMAAVLTMAMAATMIGGCGNSTDTSNAGNSTNTTESSADAADSAKDTAQNTADKTVYKVGIIQYVDDASLNQIEKAIEAELDAKEQNLV